MLPRAVHAHSTNSAFRGCPFTRTGPASSYNHHGRFGSELCRRGMNAKESTWNYSGRYFGCLGIGFARWPVVLGLQCVYRSVSEFRFRPNHLQPLLLYNPTRLHRRPETLPAAAGLFPTDTPEPATNTPEPTQHPCRPIHQTMPTGQ